MLALFGVLIIIASIVLGLIVLIQNPKGGGLSGTLGGFSNQLMGVKQTTDVLEKGTWIFAAVVGILCLISPAFIPKDGTGNANSDIYENIKKYHIVMQLNQIPLGTPEFQWITYSL